jgi:cyanophycinase
MDALLAAASAAAQAGGAVIVRVALLPTAAARSRPDLAAAHGEQAFRVAAARAGIRVEVAVADVLDRSGANEPAAVDVLENAHLVHLPGGDPDLLPDVLGGTAAWDAVLRAHAAGACVAGASAGAMVLAERMWTGRGPMDGLALVPGVAVLPHFDPARLGTWQQAVDPGGRLAWIGLDERTLVIGRPGGVWRVAGAGTARAYAPGQSGATTTGGHGATIGPA